MQTASTVEYFRYFDTRDAAIAHMKSLNSDPYAKTLYVLVDGPEDNYVVMDVKSAVNGEFAYTWLV